MGFYYSDDGKNMTSTLDVIKTDDCKNITSTLDVDENVMKIQRWWRQKQQEKERMKKKRKRVDFEDEIKVYENRELVEVNNWMDYLKSFVLYMLSLFKKQF
jgi:hypothetical protein